MVLELPELNLDGNDAGPAPLQNSVVPEETFEGVVNVADTNTANGGNADMMVTAIHGAVTSIRNNVPQPQLTPNQTTATFAHNDVLPVSGFANMSSTPYAWARAFPTVFYPTYVKEDGS